MPIESDQDWFSTTLESHPEFLRRVREGRDDMAAGRSKRLEDIPKSNPQSRKEAGLDP